MMEALQGLQVLQILSKSPVLLSNEGWSKAKVREGLHAGFNVTVPESV